MNRARAVQKRKMLDERAKVSQGDGSTHTEPYEKRTKGIIASRVGSTSVVSIDLDDVCLRAYLHR